MSFGIEVLDSDWLRGAYALTETVEMNRCNVQSCFYQVQTLALAGPKQRGRGPSGLEAGLGEALRSDPQHLRTPSASTSRR